MKTLWLHYKPLIGILDRESDPDQMPQGSVRNRINFHVPAKNKLARAPGWKKLFYDDNFAAIADSNVDISHAPASISGVSLSAGDRVFLGAQTDTTENGDYIYTATGAALTAGYNNDDLHDQLLALCHYFTSQDPEHAQDDIVSEPSDFATVCTGTIKTRTGTVREPIIFAKEFVTTSGIRKFVIGTSSRLYCYNSSTRNWQIIADGFGGTFTLDCNIRRWKAAQVIDTVIFVNNFDEPQYWIIGEGPFGCSLQAIRSIPDLVDLKIGSVNLAWAWRGLLFLADYEMGGRRYENRIMWSDYEQPISFDPSKTGTKAGDQLLDQGERILGAAELGEYLLIYTNKGIWQVTAVGGDEILNFRKVYSEPLTGEACLHYPNTLVSIGDAHVYMGIDGIYLFNLSLPKPERLEWLHSAAAAIFDDINAECCQGHASGFNPLTKEVWFSWCRAGEYLPGYTLIANMRYLSASFLNYGFSVFANYTRDERMTLRDFMLQYCICDLSGIDSLPYIKEGLPRTADAASVCAKTPNALYTTVTRDIVINGETITTEDWTAANPSANSLCNILSGIRMEDLCHQCAEEPTFIGASSSDYCLKEIGGDIYYRHRCSNPDDVGVAGTKMLSNTWDTYSASVGQYIADGYKSEILSGPIDLGIPDREKLMREILVEFNAETNSDPPELVLEVGTAAQAIDPLTAEGSCTILWQTQTTTRYYLECQSTETEASHEAAGSRPDRTVSWPLWTRGKYLYWKLTIDKPASGDDGDLPINGACNLSRLSIKLNKP